MMLECHTPPGINEANSYSLFCVLMVDLMLLFVILVVSRFGFEGWISVLIASVHGNCMLFMPHTLKKWGHIGFGVYVCMHVCMYVCMYVCGMIQNNVGFCYNF